MRNIIMATAIAATSLTANAYEYKHTNDPEQSDKFISGIVSSYHFKDTGGMGRMELATSKRNLGRCHLDMIVEDVKHHNLGMETVYELLDVVYQYYQYDNSMVRDQYMSWDDSSYVDYLNFQCIDQHPDKKTVIRKHVYSNMYDQFIEECKEGGQRDKGCEVQKAQATVKELNEEYGVQ